VFFAIDDHPTVLDFHTHSDLQNYDLRSQSRRRALDGLPQILRHRAGFARGRAYRDVY
jgi:hypothetical protein